MIYGRTIPYAQVKPCIAPGAHNFQASSPPAGQFGNALVVCTRCGISPSEARA